MDSVERAPTDDEHATIAERAARDGAAVAAETFRGGLDVRAKSRKTDLVTQADRAAQRAVIETLADATPEYEIVAEEDEARKDVPADGPAWIVDPIDGTSNYVRGIRIWGTSVAAVADGEPVAAANVLPALGDVYVADRESAWLNGEPIAVSGRSDPEASAVALTMWWALAESDEFPTVIEEIGERFGDMRRFGSAQATLSMVAGGGLEAVATTATPSPWDAVAGVRLVENAGGVVTDVYGDPWHVDADGLVASNGAVHEEAVSAVRPSDAP